MEYRKLGNSGAVVASLCLGTMTFGAEADEATSHKLLDDYSAAGGNFLDTADVYSNGASEDIVGRWLKAHPDQAKQMVVATKGRSRRATGRTTSAFPGAISRALWRIRFVASGSSRSTSTRCTAGMR